jgi:hypothetical protein
MNYNGKQFKPVSVSENGEVSERVIFSYVQKGSILSCSYSGGSIAKGHLIGLVDEDGNIDMRYHQVLDDGSLQTGICQSTPELMANGKIRLHETWKWTSGDFSEGTSIIEEV